jgi:hypothetical protein
VEQQTPSIGIECVGVDTRRRAYVSIRTAYVYVSIREHTHCACVGVDTRHREAEEGVALALVSDTT